MARAYVTIGSKFRPYSFEEQVAPLMMLEQEHQRLEDMYNSYYDNSGAVGSQLDSTLDKDILDKMYNPYMKALNDAAASLATSGITPGSRSTLSYLRRRYNNEIVPIQAAVQARQQARENWTKMSAQDRTLMTNANPYMKGVSEYMNGRSPETTYVSGNELYQRGMNLSKAFSQTMRSVPQKERLALQNQYWAIENQYGANSEEMNQFMQGVITAIPALGNQIQGILQSSGIYSNGFTQVDRDKAYNYLVEGMKAGLSGETKVQYMQNRAWEPAVTPTRNPPEKPAYNGINFTQNNFGTITNDALESDYEFATSLSSENGKIRSPKMIDIENRRAEKAKEAQQKLDKWYKRNHVTEEDMRGWRPNKEDRSDAVKHISGLEMQNWVYLRKQIQRANEFSPEEMETPEYKRYMQEERRIQELAERYKSFSDDPYKAIQKGVELDKYMASEPVAEWTMNLSPTQMKTIMNSVSNSVKSLYSEDYAKSKSIGLFDVRTGKKLSSSELDKLTQDGSFEEEFSPVGNSKYGWTFRGPNGRLYELKGNETVDNANNAFRKAKDALTTFNNTTNNKAVDVSLYQYNMANALNDASILGQGEKLEDTNYIIHRIKVNGEYMNIISVPTVDEITGVPVERVVGYTSESDQIENEGREEGRFMAGVIKDTGNYFTNFWQSEI